MNAIIVYIFKSMSDNLKILAENWRKIGNFIMQMAYVLRSSTTIKYIFNRFLFSKRSLHKKLLNIYLIEVDERNNNQTILEQTKHCRNLIVFNMSFCKKGANFSKIGNSIILALSKGGLFLK